MSATAIWNGFIRRLRYVWCGPSFPLESLEKYRYWRPEMSEEEGLAAIGRGASQGTWAMVDWDERNREERLDRILRALRGDFGGV